MKRFERGAVFLITLAVLLGLVLLVTGLAATHRESSRSQWLRLEVRRARLMVESGIQRSVAELQKQDPARATSSDPWASLGERGAVEYGIGNDGFRIQILDASGRINLNTADEATLKRLPITQQQAAALLDWREENRVARPEGAKDEYYNRLDEPYNAKLKPLDSTDELLLVKGFVPATVAQLGEFVTAESISSDRDLSGKQKLDINSASAQELAEIGVPQAVAGAIVQTREGGFHKLGDALKVDQITKEAARTILDNTMIGKDTQKTGLVNVNTATEPVLKALGLEEEIVRSILDRQKQGIRSLGDLVDLPGLSLPKLADAVDSLCVGSRSYIVRVFGRANRISAAAEAVLTITEEGQVRMTRIQPLDFRLARRNWGWDEQPETRTMIGSEE